jgi:2-polyprenyl-6-methoxyphenol hydroxylase-like FAD-dependent oxidoreductase
VLRRRVVDTDGVTVRSRCRVTDYLVDGSENVSGVVFCDREGESAEMPADLVVDATGRCSRTPTWLQEHGYAAPAVDEVSVDLAYSTVLVDRPVDDRRAVVVMPSSPRTRGGVAIPVEGDRWQVTLCGVHGDSPPRDPAGLRDFAASLPIADLEAILDAHDRVSDDIAYYPFPSNLRRRYEDLEQFPDGLIVIGDGIASFNPIYGQGMSVAALEALLLHQELAAGGRDDLAARFFDRAGKLVDTAWLISVGADFEFPQTAGPKPRGTTLFNRYLSRLVRGAHSDSALADAFYRVLRMEQSPTALLRPGVAWRTLRPI